MPSPSRQILAMDREAFSWPRCRQRSFPNPPPSFSSPWERQDSSSWEDDSENENRRRDQFGSRFKATVGWPFFFPETECCPLGTMNPRGRKLPHPRTASGRSPKFQQPFVSLERQDIGRCPVCDVHAGESTRLGKIEKAPLDQLTKIRGGSWLVGMRFLWLKTYSSRPRNRVICSSFGIVS